MTDAAERVKKRVIYRRGKFAPGQYVRLERDKKKQLAALSNQTNVEMTELVRVAVDDLLDNHALVNALRALVEKTTASHSPADKSATVKGARPKARAGGVEYFPIEELVPA
jgi:hypothetical protein